MKYSWKWPKLDCLNWLLQATLTSIWDMTCDALPPGGTGDRHYWGLSRHPTELTYAVSRWTISIQSRWLWRRGGVVFCAQVHMSIIPSRVIWASYCHDTKKGWTASTQLSVRSWFWHIRPVVDPIIYILHYFLLLKITSGSLISYRNQLTTIYIQHIQALRI